MQRLTYTWNKLLELRKDGELCYYEEVADLKAENARLRERVAALEGQRCETCAKGTSLDTCFFQGSSVNGGCQAWKERT